MKISIAQRLKPYSHNPGTRVILPFSHYAVEVFPAAVNVYAIDGSFPRLCGQLIPSIRGPVEPFTVQLDLERGIVLVSGKGSQGHFLYTIHYDSAVNRIIVHTKKAAFPLSWENSSENVILSDRDSDLCRTTFEELSLGIHRSQEWGGIRSRLDMKEIFPFWFRLGQMVPRCVNDRLEGVAELLAPCFDALAQEANGELDSVFSDLFRAGFCDLFFPTLVDDLHQGFPLGEVTGSSHVSPLLLIQEGARCLRSLFIRVEGKEITPIPLLPPRMIAGRVLQLALPEIGCVDLEWRKKTIRRMVLRADTTGEISLNLPRRIKSFRVRNGSEEGVRFLKGKSIPIIAGKEYSFDNFLS